MENASKALLIAGGVMLTMLVVSILMYGWGRISEYQAELDRIKEIEQVTKFNLQFTNYNRDDIRGYELLSLVNKVIDYNQRQSLAGTTTGHVAGNYASYTPMTIYINMWKNNISDGQNITQNFVIGKLTTTIIRPRKANGSTFFPKGGYLSLFTQQDYTQSDTKNEFGSIISEMENLEKFDSEYGGASGIQNLIKNIDSIYQGKVIGYNGNPTENDIASWYEENYIISRYKTITGKKRTIEQIREDKRVDDVLKYYEFSYFKKAIFECTNVEYDNNSGRVIKMDFNFTGRID